MQNVFKIPSVMVSTACGLVLLTCIVRAEVSQLNQTESGDLDSDGDKLTDAWERGYGRYYLIPTTLGWNEAKADAESRGGHLGTITSEAEWQTILNVIGRDFFVSKQVTWLGGQFAQGQWSWLTGEAWSYSRWRRGEPNYGFTGCLEITSDQGLWNDTASEDIGYQIANRGAYLLELGYPTDPFNADTDGDGFDDKVESDNGSDPNNAAATPDLTDRDNDGVNYYREGKDGTDPSDPTSYKPISKGLVAYYLFDGNANDESGFQRDGTVQGAASATDRFGRTNKAYSFAGGGEHIRVDSPPDVVTPGVWTTTLWVKVAAGGVSSPRFVCNGTIDVGVHGNGTFVPFSGEHPAFGGGWGIPGVTSSQVLRLEQWYFIVVTYDGQKTKIYLNGSQSAESTESGGAPQAATFGLGIGRNLDTGGDSFAGVIDDIRIYDRAISSAEVEQLYVVESGAMDSDEDGLTDAAEFLLAALGFDPFTANTAEALRLFANPNKAFLFTQAQYDLNRSNGQTDVTTSPSTFNLFTQNQVSESYTQGQNSVLQSIPSVDFSVPESTPLRVTLGGQNVIGVVVDDTESPLPDNWRLDEQAGQLVGSLVGSNSVRVVLEGEMAGGAPAIRIPMNFYPQAGQTIAPFARIPTQAFRFSPLTVTPPAASSGFAVVLSVKSGPATIVDNQLTFTGVGKVVLAANQFGNKDMKAAPEVTTSFLVTKGRQNMSFSPLNSMPFVQGSTFQLSATTSSALPIAYASSNPRVISISGSTATIVGRGVATIRATQPGDSNWASATPINRAIRIY